MILVSPKSLLIYFLVWLVAMLWHFVRTGQFQANRFRFSIFNYYVMMSAFALAVSVSAFLVSSWDPLLYFFVFTFAGVIGETLVSAWWRLFFSERFWVYTVETADHGYTSWLNFVPWGVGGSLYINTLTAITNDPFGPHYADLWSVGLMLVLGLFILQITIRNLIRPSHHRYRSITFFNFVLFFWPIVAFVSILAWMYGPMVYLIACAFGIVAALAEYLFGKSTEFFISKKLWKYSYLSLDRGHFTPLSLPLFALGGFYFWSIALVLHQIIN